MTNKAKKTLKVTQIGSTIRRPSVQARILKGLGLTKMHQTKVLEDTLSIRGMIEKIPHLVRVESN